MKHENKDFECVIPIFKNIDLDGKKHPNLIGYWEIKGQADIDNANNHEWSYHITSMHFKKSPLESRNIDYDDFHLDHEKVAEEISLQLYRDYQTRIVS